MKELEEDWEQSMSILWSLRIMWTFKRGIKGIDCSVEKCDRLQR